MAGLDQSAPAARDLAPPSITSGPPARAILKLAVPTVLAMLTQSIVNEVDIVFLGWLGCPESSNAQSALLPSLLILWLFGGSLSAISVGTQAYVGRRVAEKRDGDAGAVLLNAALFAFVAGILFSILGYLTMPAILSKIISVPEPRAAAHAYLKWRFLGVTSMTTTFAFKAFFDGIGKTHVHLVSAIVMNAINIILCLIFIFGNATLGAPKMGIAGAGFAGFVSTYVGLFILIGYALHPNYRGRFHPFTVKKLDRTLTTDIIKLSYPSAIATIAVTTGLGLFVFIAQRLDVYFPAGVASPLCPGGAGEPVNGAATTVVGGVLKLIFTACLAFGTSTATLVTQSLGEKNPDKAARFGWTSVKLGLAVFGTLGVLLAVFAPQVLAVVTKSEIVRQAALGPMRLMGIVTPLIAVGMILTQALFGAGNTRFVMVAELLLHFCVFVPLSWLFGITLKWGLMGIWWAGVAYAVLLALVMVTKFRSGDWKKIKI
ncbi:MAG: MATE family efflux transporter [Polyangiaceae bacterium]|nr:MATE family efflux transporter [Polyangiaceae bacterium]